MKKQSEQELQAGTDASLDKKLNLVPNGTKFKTPSSMNAFELDEYLRTRARHHAMEIAADLSYLVEMKNLLSKQGARTDRMKGKDGQVWVLGWQAWAKSYAAEIGSSLRTILRKMTELTAGESSAPKLTDGSIVKLSTSDEPFVVLDVHEKSNKVDVIPVEAKTAKDMKTVSADACKKVTVHTAEVGSFYIRDKETDAEYLYSGHGKLSVVAYPAVLEQKWEEERKESERHLKQEREEKEAEKKRRAAEAAKRDLDNIAEAKETKNAKRRKKKDAANTVEAGGLVKVAKLEGEDGWALFEEAESAPFTLSKASSGKFHTLVECESARDRVNERRAKKADGAVGAKAA
ncbi:MAG: hypothetical protein WA254_13300 [Candidatus Sulfotelmatobacter sp.]